MHEATISAVYLKVLVKAEVGSNCLVVVLLSVTLAIAFMPIINLTILAIERRTASVLEGTRKIIL